MTKQPLRVYVFNLKGQSPICFPNSDLCRKAVLLSYSKYKVDPITGQVEDEGSLKFTIINGDEVVFEKGYLYETVEHL